MSQFLHKDGNSLMYKLKRIGPKIEPCGTPVDNSKGVELYWSILTLCERDKRYELITNKF